MTISTEVRKAGPFVGNGSASVFPFAFKVFKAADLIVVRRQDNIGVETTLVLDSDYHVALNTNQDTTPGGVVTLTGGALGDGFTLVISSELPYLQTTDLTNQGGFYPKVITNALDRLTIFCQQLLEITGRTLKLPITAPTNISAEIPLPNPSELIAWDETGTRLTTVSPQSLVTSIAYGSATADLFAGDGVTTTFPLSTNPASVNNLDVSIDGRSQRPVQGGIGDYSWNGGASITFASPPPAPTVPGDKNVLVRYMQAIPVSDSEALHAQTREALRRSYAEAGYNLVEGSFETGGTLTSTSDVLLLESAGTAYAWAGAYPVGGYDVAPGIDPTVAPVFVLKSLVVLREELGEFVTRVSTPADISTNQPIGSIVETNGRYSGVQGGGRYIITSGASPYPLVDPQVAPDRYAKLLPLPGTNYGYSLLQAGGKNNLDTSTTTSRVINQLLAKVHTESPLIGGLIHAEGGQYYLAEAVVRPTAGAKHLGIIGERSNNSYGTYESRTVFYFDDGLAGDFALDFFDTQFMTFSDFAMRGQSLKGGLRLGKAGSYVPGFGGHLLERVQATHCTDGILLRNGGACTLRDIQAAENFNRGVALESSGDTNIYNVYANGNNKDTIDSSLTKGVGLYIGVGSNNTNIFGGKLEFNSKGLVIHGSNGVNYVGLQFDYNSMANLVVSSIDDAVNACRGNHATGCRFLSGGVIDGLQKAGIYLDSALGSVSLSITGGGIQAAGNGAYDTSTAGVIGPKKGIHANGNNTYSLDVIGGDMLLTFPGVDYAVVATGAGTSVKLNGTGGKKAFFEANGAKVHVGFNRKQTGALALTGSSGTPTYSNASQDCEVIDGFASVDMLISLSSVGSLAGDISITGIPYTNTSTSQASVVFGMVAGLSYDLFGYILPGESNVILWKKTGGGNVSRLSASDLTNLTLIRASVKMKVS